jgi:hypothetical protein
LGARAFDVLLLLAEHRGTVVDKHDVLRKVWHGRGVGENNVTVQIATLRHVLGTMQDGRSLIQTISGEGYILVADEDSSHTRASLTHHAGNEAGYHARLDDDRVVVVCGVEDIDKARLALQSASNALPLFPDGIWLIDLEGVSAPADIAAAIADGLGETDDGPALRRIVRHLAGKRALLILDKCDQAAAATAEVARQLLSHCPGVMLLLSGRRDWADRLTIDTPAP